MKSLYENKKTAKNTTLKRNNSLHVYYASLNEQRKPLGTSLSPQENVHNSYIHSNKCPESVSSTDRWSHHQRDRCLGFSPFFWPPVISRWLRTPCRAIFWYPSWSNIHSEISLVVSWDIGGHVHRFILCFLFFSFWVLLNVMLNFTVKKTGSEWKRGHSVNIGELLLQVCLLILEL